MISSSPGLLQWLLPVGRPGSWNENEMPTTENSETEPQGFMIGRKPFHVAGG